MLKNTLWSEWFFVVFINVIMEFFWEKLQQLSNWLHEINFGICLILQLSGDVIDLICFGVELINIFAVLISSYLHNWNVRILIYDEKYFAANFNQRKMLLIKLSESLLGLLAVNVKRWYFFKVLNYIRQLPIRGWLYHVLMVFE